MPARIRQCLLETCEEARAFMHDAPAEGEPVQSPAKQALLATARSIAANLSAQLADARRLSNPAFDPQLTFKLLNLPQWPQARMAAWLKRQKVDVSVRPPHHAHSATAVLATPAQRCCLRSAAPARRAQRELWASRSKCTGSHNVALRPWQLLHSTPRNTAFM